MRGGGRGEGVLLLGFSRLRKLNLTSGLFSRLFAVDFFASGQIEVLEVVELRDTSDESLSSLSRYLRVKLLKSHEKKRS